MTDLGLVPAKQSGGVKLVMLSTFKSTIRNVRLPVKILFSVWKKIIVDVASSFQKPNL